MSRHAGVMLPLFSAPSSRSWGAGELPDLATLSSWLASAGFDRLLILPIGVIAGDGTSPYSAMSAMAIDPMYVSLDELPDWQHLNGAEALNPELRAAIDSAMRSKTVQYDAIRLAKTEALSLSFERFLRDEWAELTTRASRLAGYIARERWWLDDFALYQAVADATGLASWRAWPAALRDRQPGALDEARRTLARQVLKQQYFQWTAETQWQQAKADAHARGVTVFGDLPFMVTADSPDVWVRPDEFMFDVSLGVPPDAFSATGQDWNLPTYRWDRIAAGNFGWMRQRAKRMAALYDGYRVDHLVGLYRTYGRPPGGEPFFTPAGESAQVAQGEALLRILLESGAEVIAEDLGVVPDFVRESLARIGVPGCKVLRWERHWQAPGQPFVDPREYPANSAAMTGTHDTETLAGWWTSAPAEDRQAMAAFVGADLASADWSPAVHAAMLQVAYQSGSNDLFLPIQDVFGWLDRINIPATVGDHNWTWKLPWFVDRAHETDAAREAAAKCRVHARQSQRTLDL